MDDVNFNNFNVEHYIFNNTGNMDANFLKGFVSGGVFIGLLLSFINHKSAVSNYNDLKADTTYNKVVLDRIDYNIQIKDTTIYNIKKEMINYEEDVYNLTDSSTIVLFKQLLSDN